MFQFRRFFDKLKVTFQEIKSTRVNLTPFYRLKNFHIIVELYFILHKYLILLYIENASLLDYNVNTYILLIILKVDLQ